MIYSQQWDLVCNKYAFGLTHLMNQVDTVVQLLTLEEGMKIIEKVVQLFLTIPVWYNDSCTITSHTVLRAIAATWLDIRIFVNYVFFSG